jgi:hypothetical protein
MSRECDSIKSVLGGAFPCEFRCVDRSMPNRAIIKREIIGPDAAPRRNGPHPPASSQPIRTRSTATNAIAHARRQRWRNASAKSRGVDAFTMILLCRSMLPGQLSSRPTTAIPAIPLRCCTRPSNAIGSRPTRIHATR